MKSSKWLLLLVGFTLAACAGDGQLGDVCDEATEECVDPPDSDTYAVDDISLPRAKEGVPYSAFFTASNGSDPLQWNLSDGALPPGLTLLESGNLSGIPDAGAATASPYTFTVAVTDIQAFVATRSFSLVVDPADVVQRFPFDDMNDVSLYLNLGDSFAAGYNASDGRGYAPLVHRNHSSYSTYSSHHLQARFTSTQLVNRAESGATSNGVVSQTNSLPDAGNGDVVVTIYSGGNDVNDDIETLLLDARMTAAINNWTSNMTTVLQRLRAAYDHPDNGQLLTVLIATVHDPTDGMGTIPSQYSSDYCGTIQQMPDYLRPQALANFHRFNEAVREFVTANNAIILDSNVLFLGHGLNAAPAEQWIDSDCAHGNNEGHNQVRREIWYLLSGQRY